MPDSVCVDTAAVNKWKTTLLEHLRRRPRDKIRLGDLRKDTPLFRAVEQLMKEQGPRLALVDFGDSMTLSWQITLDGLSPEALNYLRQEQLILNADDLMRFDGELPDAPGNPQAPAVEGSE